VYGGGHGEPAGLFGAGNIFLANNALYGNDVATQGMQLAMGNDATSLLVADYEAPAPAFSILMQDVYGQLVLSESSNFIEILVHENSSLCVNDHGAVSGEVIERFERGVGNFTALQARCAPGHSLLLTAAVDINILLLTQDFSLEFRNCSRGEYYRAEEGVCVPCPFGTFSFTESRYLQELQQLEVCLPCPGDAVECYGDSIRVKRGFWRLNVSILYVWCMACVCSGYMACYELVSETNHS
jgi:hypothetical protein